MSQNQKRLAESLHSLFEKADRADRDNESCCSLSPQEIKVLRTVGSSGCCIMSAIAGAVRLSLSTATGLIDRLCEKKLVSRERSSDDRRIVQVQLTPEGKELHEAAFKSRVALAKEMMDRLNLSEQESLIALLEKASGEKKEAA